jgi:beta-glucosidase
MRTRTKLCRPTRSLGTFEVTLLAMALLAASSCQNRPATKPKPSVSELLSKLTLAQKIRLIHGEREKPATYQGQAGYLAGDPTLGIPEIRLADGPPGVLMRHRSTAPTATMGVAATFSREDARENGVVIGRDARALGIDVALQPFINIFRDPTWERAYNLFGEDPLLVGAMGAGEVKGIQSQDVMAEAKHFVAYNGGDNVVVGQQALHEIYAAPFVAAVNAGAASIMCSYNQINGAYACGNSQTLQTLLRQEIGFKGFVTSDWGATHATNFINDGLNLEMPGAGLPLLPCYFCAKALPPASAAQRQNAMALFFGSHIPEEPAQQFDISGFLHMAPSEGMLAALKAGQVNPARIDAAVGRILLQEDRFGWLTRKLKHNVTPVPFDEDVKIVEKTAEDAAVLLKNEDHALPLTPSDLKSLALIGPGAGQTITIGESGEKSLGFPSRDLSPLAAIEQATADLPGRHIAFAVADNMTGSPIPAALLSHDGHPGLQREDARGQKTAVDPILDFTKKNGDPLPPSSSFSWQGTLRIPKAGVYWVYLQLMGCAAQLEIDGKLRARSSGLIIHGDYIQAAQDNVLPTTDNLDDVRVALSLAAGSHSLRVIEHADGSGRPVQIRLNWLTPQARQVDYDAALKAARNAKKVVVFAWGRGRPAYDLPGDQDKLISAIAGISPNTIVILNSSQPAALPWLDQVKAVLEMWYPGDGGGVATANVLLGRSDPAGRLPFTWAQRLNQYVSHDPAHPERSSKGVNGVTTFSEGIFVGYRWFDEQHIEPLFPFGYGLSYAKFRYSNLSVTPASDGGLTVRFAVRNVGKVYGDEVPQVYLGAPENPPAGAQFAVRALAGFDRIGIQPGQDRELDIHVPLRELQYWSKSASNWQTAAGERAVYVGASSRDLRLRQRVTIRSR